MRLYVFYDRKTGRIVHEHRQTDGPVRSDADLFKLVHPSNKKLSLEVMQVDEKKLEAGRGYRIDPKKRTLQAGKKDGPRGHSSVQHAPAVRK